MKKNGSSLLVIAVMFTFSFGSAFAAPADMTKVVTDSAAALAKITEKYNAELGKLNSALVSAKDDYYESDNWTKAEWNAVAEENYAELVALLDAQLAAAYQAFGQAEQNALAADQGGILGYEFATMTPAADGYAYIAPAIAQINAANIQHADWVGGEIIIRAVDLYEAHYDDVLAKTIALIQNYNVEKFVKDDKVTINNVTKSSYEWAVKAQGEALAKLGAFDDYNKQVAIGGQTITCNATAVEAVYKVTAAGTEGEAESGSFYDAIKNLKTTTVATTDTAKIEYAKAAYEAVVKTAMANAKAGELKTQNDIIFAQSIATKPNQKLINDAKEEIEKIEKKYAALEEVWLYRLANASYAVDSNVVRGYYDANANGVYDDGYIFTAGTFSGSSFTVGGFTVTAGVIDAAVAVADLVDDLEDEAEALKATIYVDGAAALDVDAALAKAVEKAYMTGAATLTVAKSDTVVHNNAHKLLGTNCANANESTAKITVDGKKYEPVAAWDDALTSYSTNNAKAIKAIVKAVKAEIKAAETVAEANAAFLAAYAEYDAVMTKTEQANLFAYTGALYKKDVAAEAELAAYLDYKVALMEDAPAAADVVKNAVKTYFGIQKAAAVEANDYVYEVVDAASFDAAVAEVKAVVDNMKTKTELKAEGDALAKKATAVVRAVTLAQKEEILALYDELVDYADYCTMVGYGSHAGVQSATALVKTDIERLEDLEKAALDDAKKELGAVAKITLEDKAAVEAFAAAEDAYDALYGATAGEYKAALAAPANYNQSGVYETKIFALEVAAAEALIKALPVNADAAAVVAAREAVDALGFEGICAVSEYWLTKLDKFEADAEVQAIYAVETLKITAGSTAKKGSITVKWSVDGDEEAVQAYEIWKSTKKNSGFKKAFTTEKKSYKNTKGLKKGTRYYYKVRAIATVDGVKYTSDWSNKAYRIAK